MVWKRNVNFFHALSVLCKVSIIILYSIFCLSFCRVCWIGLVPLLGGWAPEGDSERDLPGVLAHQAGPAGHSATRGAPGETLFCWFPCHPDLIKHGSAPCVYCRKCKVRVQGSRGSRFLQIKNRHFAAVAFGISKTCLILTLFYILTRFSWNLV